MVCGGLWYLVPPVEISYSVELSMKQVFINWGPELLLLIYTKYLRQ